MCGAACFTSASSVWSRQLLSESGFNAVLCFGRRRLPERRFQSQQCELLMLLLSLAKCVATGGLYIGEGGHPACIGGQTRSLPAAQNLYTRIFLKAGWTVNLLLRALSSAYFVWRCHPETLPGHITKVTFGTLVTLQKKKKNLNLREWLFIFQYFCGIFVGKLYEVELFCRYRIWNISSELSFIYTRTAMTRFKVKFWCVAN